MNPVRANAIRGATMLASALLLASCATPPPAPVAPAGPPPLTDAQIVEATRAAGRDGVELVVTPLVDPHVEDLRERAAKAQADGKPKKADRELLKALEITPDDPDLLQWRERCTIAPPVRM